MGETQTQPFQLSFNASLRVEFQGSRVTSDGGLILVRELDERLGFSDLIAERLTDPRATNTTFPLADLVRTGALLRDEAAGPRREPRRSGRAQPGAGREGGSHRVPAAGGVDLDSTEIPVYGQQEQSAYNGHFECASRLMRTCSGGGSPPRGKARSL